jgi:pimeloyl-ACP methyl ester carboxylesterase
MTEAFPIKRAFADVGARQVHYRHAGAGKPLLALHGSPASSRQMVRLMSLLADGDTHVIAPDMPGNGDSPAIADVELSIAELATATLEFVDALGIDTFDIYGTHTGGAIGAEIAIQAPDRVRRFVLDGAMELTAEELDDLLANYAFPFPADRDGAYLARVFQFCRDQYVFHPWYNRTREGRRDASLPSAEDLHAFVVEVLKGNISYHHNYRAAFRWNAPERMPLIPVPTLTIAAGNDPLFDSTARLAPLVPNGSFAALPPTYAEGFGPQLAQLIKDYLAAA